MINSPHNCVGRDTSHNLYGHLRPVGGTTTLSASYQRERKNQLGVMFCIRGWHQRCHVKKTFFQMILAQTCRYLHFIYWSTREGRLQCQQANLNLSAGMVGHQWPNKPASLTALKCCVVLTVLWWMSKVNTSFVKKKAPLRKPASFCKSHSLRGVNIKHCKHPTKGRWCLCELNPHSQTED